MSSLFDRIQNKNKGQGAEQNWEKLADRCIRQNLYGDAEDAYRHILDSLGETGNEAYLGRICFRLAIVLQRQNKLFDAEKEMRRAYGIFSRLAEDEPEKYPDDAAICAVKLGSILSDMDDIEKALRFYREAEPVVEKSDHLRRWFLGQVRIGIRRNLILLGRYDEAETCPEESLFDRTTEPCIVPPFCSHRLSAVFDRDWCVFGWDYMAEADADNDAWMRNLTEAQIRLIRYNRLKTHLSAVIRMAEDAAGNANDFTRWKRLIQKEGDAGWLYFEVGGQKADVHYQTALKLCDIADDRFSGDAENRAQINSLRGLTEARRSVWMEQNDRTEEEREALYGSISSYMDAYRCLDKLNRQKTADIESLEKKLTRTPSAGKTVKGWRKAVRTVLAVAAVLALAAGGLYLWAINLNDLDLWNLPDFVGNPLERMLYRAKTIHWYTEVEWRTDYNEMLMDEPKIYRQESGEILWDRLTEHFGFEPVAYSPGVEIENPANPEKTLTVSSGGAITYSDKSVFKDTEECVCLFGSEGLEKVTEYLAALGIDPSEYRCLAKSYVMGDAKCQSRTLPDGSKEYADAEQLFQLSWSADENMFSSEKRVHTIEITLYYDRLAEAVFSSFAPIRQDSDLASMSLENSLYFAEVREYLKNEGIWFDEPMGELRCVTIETTEWTYFAAPLDFYYTPMLQIDGRATDGFRIMPFRIYLDQKKD